MKPLFEDDSYAYYQNTKCLRDFLLRIHEYAKYNDRMGLTFPIVYEDLVVCDYSIEFDGIDPAYKGLVAVNKEDDFYTGIYDLIKLFYEVDNVQ